MPSPPGHLAAKLCSKCSSPQWTILHLEVNLVEQCAHPNDTVFTISYSEFVELFGIADTARGFYDADRGLKPEPMHEEHPKNQKSGGFSGLSPVFWPTRGS